MTFNPELIAKARKGEIAILNDGSVEKLREICQEVLADDFYASGKYNYYMLIDDVWNGFIHCKNEISHSVKDFFMPTTEKMEDFEVHNGNAETVIPGQPRTYRVTRQQMKEIWEATHEVTRLMALMNSWFTAWDNETEINESRFNEIRRCFNHREPEVLKKHFPEYFHIPEGEPVLCRNNLGNWIVGVSDGNGEAYVSFSYKKAQHYDQIIPYTKQPPK